MDRPELEITSAGRLKRAESYNFLKYRKFDRFTDSLTQHDQAHFQVLMEEWKLVARTAPQLAVDTADTSSRAMTMATVMHRECWLHFCGFPRECRTLLKTSPSMNPIFLI